jgi:Ca2+-binding EF-hand superfamily protein
MTELTECVFMLSINKARQILGERGQKLTDKEVQDLLVLLQRLCDKVIDGVVNENNKD